MANTLTAEYFHHINSRYKAGNATEHTYRGDLQQLIENIVSGVVATNEPQRIKCGAPDYVITKKDIPVGYIEAKDLGVGLDAIEKSEQLKRYRESLENLILTDYVEFRLFKNGEKVSTIKIAELQGGKLKPLGENYEAFENFIKDFCAQSGQTITSAEKLAKMMAGKARLMAAVLESALKEDIEDKLNPDTSLQEQFNAFQLMLIHDLTEKQFADIYSQTIAYGMFAARLHDPTIGDFTRREAAELIPRSNPFLRWLFQSIAGYDLDTRLTWIVDALADVFRAADVKAILKNFGKSTQTLDPMIHFYETFLGEYNPAERKKRGVYYTPEPVVNFIVRAVDDILKTEFGLKEGLASTETTEIETTVTDKKGKATKQKQTVHRVQILDPATGTGTFLAEIIKQVYKKFEGQQGIWSDYVENHLIPRVNGFEILMASYAMCHLKLEMLLTETGYVPKRQNRFKVYLTNSLEEATENTLNLFTQWLSNESIEANSIKRETPVMVVIGNPPYSVSSSNKGPWIQNLIKDYKEGLNERKINLDDDYIKFIRYAEHFIEKNGQGIVAMITNNSFIGGITHRQMRKHLLSTFDKIYIMDLHGDSNRQEAAPDGTPDQNIFDIMQGVCISLFIKTADKKDGLGKIFHSDLYGRRDVKYNDLNKNTLRSIEWSDIKYEAVNAFFIPKNLNEQLIYDEGFSLDDLFINKNTGIQTKNDSLTLQFSLSAIKKIEHDFLTMDIDSLKVKYGIKDGTWKISDAKADLLTKRYVHSDILVKPFDKRFTLLNQTSSGFLGRPRYSTMQHMKGGNNLALLLSRQNKSETIDSFFVTNTISEMKCAERTIQSYHFPLYLYPENTDQTNLHAEEERTPNLNMKIVGAIEKKLRTDFAADKSLRVYSPDKPQAGWYEQDFGPEDLLDYIYAVLHSPSYREKYKEFLKIDFPRVPYPSDKKSFWKLVALGTELRELHLLESEKVNKLITKFSVSGDNVVGKIRFEENYEIVEGKTVTIGEPVYRMGRVYINASQYFDAVPLSAWEFFIGGYQPAQKWLKDRKERALSFEDILHYQKMIVSLYETGKVMEEIDTPNPLKGA